VIARKRAALREREARVIDMRDFWLAEWDPMRRWSARRIRTAARKLSRRDQRTRLDRTARSRWQYGCRTGGRW
jgi:hypothetical protein